MREHCLRSAQRSIPFKQCAGLVPALFTRRLRGIRADMWLNKRWNSQTAFRIKHFALR